MSKKVEENLKSEEFWTLPKYKNKFGTDEYHEHLKKFLAKNDFEKLFRALKYSDILLKKSEKIKKTKNIILENCSTVKSENLCPCSLSKKLKLNDNKPFSVL